MRLFGFLLICGFNLYLFTELLLQNLFELVNFIFRFIFVLIFLLFWFLLALRLLRLFFLDLLWFLLHFLLLLLLFATLLIECRKHVDSLLRQLVLSLVVFNLRLLVLFLLLHRQNLLSFAQTHLVKEL